MAKPRLSPQLIKKLSNATGKSQQYVREQVSKRSSRFDVSSEAVLVNWAKQEKIATGRYVNTLSQEIRQEIRSLNSQVISNTPTRTRLAINNVASAKTGNARTSKKRPWWEHPWTVGVGAVIVGVILTIIAHQAGWL